MKSPIAEIYDRLTGEFALSHQRKSGDPFGLNDGPARRIVSDVLEAIFL